MSRPLNVVGPQVRKLRNQKGWTQDVLARKLQLAAWDISRSSLGKLESQLRRVPDIELLFLAKVLQVPLPDLFPTNTNLRRVGPQLRAP